MPITPEQFEEMRRRVEKQTPVERRTSAAVERERDLHDEIEKHCTERGYLYIHSRMDAPSTIQVGTPDFAIFMPDGKAVFLECKAKTTKTTTKQLGKIAHARKLGFVAEVVDNFEDAKKVMANPLFPSQQA